MSQLKLCRECKWAITPEAGWLLQCSNPIVNMGDPWALAAVKPVAGTACREEREKGFIRGVCGMRGAKWEKP